MNRITKAWLRAWASEYPGNDPELRGLTGKPRFTRRQLERILDWKLRRLWPAQAKRNLAKNSDRFIKTTTEAAFSASHDFAALMALTALKGVGVRVASAILTARDPERFTVIDDRAWNSLIKNGRLKAFADASWAEAWVPYLEECRNLEEERTEASGCGSGPLGSRG